MLKNIINNNFYTSCIDGEISTYCNQVKCGSKPIALMNLKTAYVDIVTNQIREKYNLNVYIQDIQNYPEFKIIFIYKHESINMIT